MLPLITVMHIEEAQLIEKKHIGAGYTTLRLHSPAIALSALPGQFIHLKIPDLEGMSLRRPFSIYRAVHGEILILFKRVGRGTAAMESLPTGTLVNIMGPLGRPFPSHDKSAVPLLVAGGYGVAPLSFLAESMPTSGFIFIGGRTSADILCKEDFAKWKISVATEDGSEGTRGMVTVPLEEHLIASGGISRVLYACGPDGMLKAVADISKRYSIPAWISLDRHMGCGVGACLACVQKILRSDGSAAWGRVCRDGPVFNANEILWS